MQNTSLPINSQRMGLMDHPVWWDEETVVADRTEYSLAAYLKIFMQLSNIV
jgi:hypothetical protein